MGFICLFFITVPFSTLIHYTLINSGPVRTPLFTETVAYFELLYISFAVPIVENGF